MDTHKIGIGISTRNRHDTLAECLKNIYKYLPPNAKVVVVDDASDKPVENADFRFNVNVGVAATKNKIFHLLEDCEHIFTYDDDCWPIADNWWLPYINSGQPHLMRIFQDFPKGPKLHDTIKVYEDDRIVAYSHPRGCMLYYHRSCLELVGGMDSVFGLVCHEHPDLSNRIYNAGLTMFRFMDVKNSHELIYSLDEHRAIQTTWNGKLRADQIKKNTPIYESRYSQKIFFPYKEGQIQEVVFSVAHKRNEVLTCYFTGVPDPQGVPRQTDMMQVLIQLSPLVSTCINHGNEVMFFHDHEGTKAGCYERDTEKGRWYLNKATATINPYWQRWVTYREYLIKNRNHLGFVWCVDATDVEMLRDPFPHMEYGKLYVGDEPGNIGGNVWLTRHHKHPQLQHFFRNNFKPLLNAGLVGGDVETMIEFTGLMIDIYQRCEHDAQIKGWPNSGMTDMGALNYVVYTHFKGRFSHGKHVNTVFKGYEADNGLSFWRHK